MAKSEIPGMNHARSARSDDNAPLAQATQQDRDESHILGVLYLSNLAPNLGNLGKGGDGSRAPLGWIGKPLPSDKRP